MKKKKMLQAMNLLDEKYVDEASPGNAKNIEKRKGSKKTRFLLTAACVAVLLSTLGLWLFIPFNTDPPDVSEYSDSEYYSIIQKLNQITYKTPKYKNNFELLLSSLQSVKNSDDYFAADGELRAEVEYDEPTNNSGLVSGIDSEYVEVTDNQVSGVIESDLIKRSDKYIFYLRDKVLSVYSIEKENSKEIAQYSMSLSEDYFGGQVLGLYLSEDCNTVTIIQSCYKRSDTNGSGSYSRSLSDVVLISLDVSNVEEGIGEIGRIKVTGSHISSRLVDGKLLLISGFYVGNEPDFSDEKTFLPQIDFGYGEESVPLKAIIAPEKLTSAGYTVVCKIDAAAMTLEDCSAFLSYSQQVYVSSDSVYATRSYNDEKTDGNNYINKSMTEISRLVYVGEKFDYKGSVTVEGYVNDQYSLDEYEGVLRVVTTTSVSVGKRYYGEDAVELTDSSLAGTNANLYCINIGNMQIVASVESFAPQGETVRSVRFDKTNAYVCTSVMLSDPVFFFDLSDINNITWKDTGTIEGFSTSLVDFGNGFLLGIGVGSSWDTLKIEMYRESGDKVISVRSYEIQYASYSSEYKSYLIDRENRFVGLGVNYRTGSGYFEEYILLYFDNYSFHELVKTEFFGEVSTMRAVFIDGYLYMFSDVDFAVEKVG